MNQTFNENNAKPFLIVEPLDAGAAKWVVEV